LVPVRAIPGVSFQSLALAVGHNPHSVSFVSGIDGTSWNNERLPGVADPLQVRKHSVEAHRDMPSNILAQQHAGSEPFNKSANLRPEVTVIVLACSLPGQTERLARVSAGNKVNSSIVVWFESSHIVVYRSAREVFGEDASRPWVYLAECRRLDSSDHLSRKCEAANPTKQIKMHNKTLHGMPRSILREFVR
jgi:hypothetical protein